MRFSILLDYCFQFYFWLLIVRIFLTWIPTIDWNSPFFSKLAAVCDIYLNPFRRIIPAFGGLDFSPIVAILFLQFCAKAIIIALSRMGL